MCPGIIFMEVKSVKAKFSKLAIVMSAVLVLMSAIPVVGMACLFCDEEVTEEQETVIVDKEEVITPDPIQPTDAVK